MGREHLKVSAHPSGVINDAESAVGMGYHIVPGGHHLSGLRFGGIPRWRNVSVRAVKYSQGFNVVGDVAPDGVRTGDMTTQSAERTWLQREVQRNVIGINSAR